MQFSNPVTAVKLLIILLSILISGLMSKGALRNEGEVNAQSVDSALYIDEVIIEAYQITERLRRIPGSVSVISSRELKLTDGYQLPTLLNILPGVHMQSGTPVTGRIVIRGMGSRTPYNTNRIRAWLNGLPVTGSDGVSSVEDIDMKSLGRIEIVKGPSSALYGSGLGGSLNLYTPFLNRDTASIRLLSGSFNTWDVLLSGNRNFKKSDLWGSLSHMQTDGYRGNSDYRRTSLLSAIRKKGEIWSAEGTLLISDVKGGIPSSLTKTMFEESPESAAPNWNLVKGYQKFTRVLGGLTLTARLSGRIANQLTLFGQWYDNYELRPFNNLDDQFLNTGLRNKINIHGTNFDLVAGFEIMSDIYRWTLDMDNILINKNQENRSHGQIFAVSYLRLSPELLVSFAGAVNQTRYRLTDLFPHDGNQEGEHNFPVLISPRAGISYSAGKDMVMYASAGHGFSLPSPEETLLPEGTVNTDIKPEQGIQGEAGIRFYMFRERVNLDAAIYWIELRDLLVTKRLTEDIFTGINAGKTRHRGLEIKMQNIIFKNNRFPGRLESLVSYTGSINTFTDFEDDGIRYDGNYLPGIPGRNIRMQLIWNPLRFLEFVNHLEYTGNQYLDDGNYFKQPGYFLGNIKITTAIPAGKFSGLKFFAGINNLTNTRYASMIVVNAIAFGDDEPRYYYPGMPLNIFGGVSVEL
jgi:iron complex outermembrane receptor protein